MKSLIRRIHRLESRAQGVSGIKVRFGKLLRLPEQYQGERHVEIAGRLPNRGDQEWFDYKEVPGPGPVRPRRYGIPECIDVIFVAPYRR